MPLTHTVSYQLLVQIVATAPPAVTPSPLRALLELSGAVKGSLGARSSTEGRITCPQHRFWISLICKRPFQSKSFYDSMILRIKENNGLYILTCAAETKYIFFFVTFRPFEVFPTEVIPSS